MLLRRLMGGVVGFGAGVHCRFARVPGAWLGGVRRGGRDCAVRGMGRRGLRVVGLGMCGGRCVVVGPRTSRVRLSVRLGLRMRGGRVCVGLGLRTP